MLAIGHIQQLQIQPQKIKVKNDRQEYYDPSRLLSVHRLCLTARGIFGITKEGEQIIDVHHADHPESRNHDGFNDISIGFTSHYVLMRDRFGSHLYDGCAGENILVETTNSYQLEDLGQQLAIQSRMTGEFVYLTDLSIAKPCLPFSTYASDEYGLYPPSGEQIKEALQFLHHGMRGFYTKLAQPQKATIDVGDTLFMLQT